MPSGRRLLVGSQYRIKAGTTKAATVNAPAALRTTASALRGPVSVITPTVVKEVCSRLLAKAVEAEREDQSPAQTEDMVLEEFSDCLNEIVMTMFNTH